MCFILPVHVELWINILTYVLSHVCYGAFINPQQSPGINPDIYCCGDKCYQRGQWKRGSKQLKTQRRQIWIRNKCWDMKWLQASWFSKLSYHKESEDDDFLGVFAERKVAQVLLLNMLFQKGLLSLLLLWFLVTTATAPWRTLPPPLLQRAF